MLDRHSLAWTSRPIITGSIRINRVCSREVHLFSRTLSLHGGHDYVLARVLPFEDRCLLTSFESEQIDEVILRVSDLTHPDLHKLWIEQHFPVSPIRVLIIHKHHQDYLESMSSFRDDNLSDILIALYRVDLIIGVNIPGDFPDPCVI